MLYFKPQRVFCLKENHKGFLYFSLYFIKNSYLFKVLKSITIKHPVLANTTRYCWSCLVHCTPRLMNKGDQAKLIQICNWIYTNLVIMMSKTLDQKLKRKVAWNSQFNDQWASLLIYKWYYWIKGLIIWTAN